MRRNVWYASGASSRMSLEVLVVLSVLWFLGSVGVALLIGGMTTLADGRRPVVLPEVPSLPAAVNAADEAALVAA